MTAIRAIVTRGPERRKRTIPVANDSRFMSHQRRAEDRPEPIDWFDLAIIQACHAEADARADSYIGRLTYAVHEADANRDERVNVEHEDIDCTNGDDHCPVCATLLDDALLDALREWKYAVGTDYLTRLRQQVAA